MRLVMPEELNFELPCKLNEKMAHPEVDPLGVPFFFIKSLQNICFLSTNQNYTSGK